MLYNQYIRYGKRIKTMEDNIIWYTEQDQRVEIGIQPDYYTVSVLGQYFKRHTDFSPVPAAAKAKAAKMGVVAFLGPVAITAERKARILAMRTELFPPAPRYSEPDALLALEAKLDAARERVLRHDANPGIAYAAQAKAQATLDAWKAAHADEWAAVAAHRKAESDARKADNADAVARAARGED
jgi:hypothetical protein